MAGIEPTLSQSSDWTMLQPCQLSQGGCLPLSPPLPLSVVFLLIAAVATAASAAAAVVCKGRGSSCACCLSGFFTSLVLLLNLKLGEQLG
jgi:hypothetical protein